MEVVVVELFTNPGHFNLFVALVDFALMINNSSLRIGEKNIHDENFFIAFILLQYLNVTQVLNQFFT